MKYRLALLLPLLSVLSLPAQACAIFSLSDSDTALLGNNEDYVKPGVIWFEPAEEGRLGRVNVGFDDDFAQGSMNARGLAFDSAALNEGYWEEDPDKPTPDNLLERIMDACGTVEEALAYFERYNCRHLREAHFLFADATGDAALVAWLPGTGLHVERRDGLVSTNTRLGLSGYRCQRWMRAQQVIAARGDASVATAAAVLEAIHQHGPEALTSYSTVYDLKARTVTLYNLADFSEAVTFDLAEELAGGRTVHRMARLFPEGRTLRDMRGMPQRTTWPTRVAVDADLLARYEGF